MRGMLLTLGRASQVSALPATLLAYMLYNRPRREPKAISTPNVLCGETGGKVFMVDWRQRWKNVATLRLSKEGDAVPQEPAPQCPPPLKKE